MKNLKDGVAFRDGKLDFDLDRDWYDDVILLQKKGLNNKIFSRMGIAVFFGYVLTKPETFNKKEIDLSRNSIRSLIKNYDKLSSDDLQKVNHLLQDSIKHLNSYNPINEFDMVVSVDSTAPLNKYIIEQIRPFCKNDVMIVSDLFVKNEIQNIDLDWEMLDRSESESAKNQAMDLYNNVLKNKNKFYIKDLRGSFRRYFINFLKFNDNTQKNVFEHIFGKKVLLIDDTVGEVATFRDMVRLISTYKPSEYLCYAFLKDY